MRAKTCIDGSNPSVSASQSVPHQAQAGAPRKGPRHAGLRIFAGSLWCAICSFPSRWRGISLFALSAVNIFQSPLARKPERFATLPLRKRETRTWFSENRAIHAGFASSRGAARTAECSRVRAQRGPVFSRNSRLFGLDFRRNQQSRGTSRSASAKSTVDSISGN